MKRLLLGMIWLSISLLGFGALARADVNDFVINNFTADYYLNRNDPQGEMRIVEQIDLTFSDNNHGILRAIPERYKKQSLKIRVNQVTSPTQAPAMYTTYGQNDNLVLKIGNPDRTVTGHQQYVIDYTVRNVVTFYDGYDELFRDINGDQWAQSFRQVTARVHLPTDLKPTNQKCFTGEFNSTAQDCNFVSGENEVTVRTTQTLSPYETLSIVLAFPKDYFVAPSPADWWKDHYRKVLAVIAPPLLIGLWAYRRWRAHGKDLKGRGTIVPEYESPQGLSAAEAATVYSYRLDPKDVSATIIDLAIRKYLRIIEIHEKKILKDQKTYEFELLHTDWKALKPHESKILGGLFLDPTIRTKISLDSLKNKFYKTIQSLQKDIPARLTKAGYFTSNPTKAGNGLYVRAFLCAVLAFFLSSWISVGLGIAALILGIFGVIMPKRSQTGVLAKEALDGLKMYLTTAEKDRIKMLQSPDAPYAPKTGEPKRTVELFEKLLPYAIVLGVEKDWAEQFEHIYKTPPDWYGGNWRTFNSVYLASSLSGSVSAMGTNFGAPSSSGGSGFSGGGGSGGGGGGGGGGGW